MRAKKLASRYIVVSFFAFACLLMLITLVLHTCNHFVRFRRLFCFSSVSPRYFRYQSLPLFSFLLCRLVLAIEERCQQEHTGALGVIIPRRPPLPSAQLGQRLLLVSRPFKKYFPLQPDQSMSKSGPGLPTRNNCHRKSRGSHGM